jgi:eukaryotic translation initiation factor 2C
MHQGLPVINVGNRQDPVWLPAEVCTVLKGQPYRNKLSDEHTATMINFACKAPKENALLIENTGIPKLGLGDNNKDLVGVSNLQPKSRLSC